MASATIAYDFYSVEPIVNVRVLGDPELLARLAGYCRVVASHHGIAKHGAFLSNYALDPLIKLELMKFLATPGREPASLSVVIATSEEHLGSDE